MGTLLDLQRVFRNKGRLCLDPSDLSTDFPHGGTGVGWVTEIEFRIVIGQTPIRAEEFGEVVDVLTTDREFLIAATVREFDLERLQPVLTKSTGAVTSEDLLTFNSSSERAGTLQAGNANALFFSPDNQKHPSVLFYRSIILPEETSRINLRLNDDMTFGLMAYAVRDATGRVLQIGNIKDLTL